MGRTVDKVTETMEILSPIAIVAYALVIEFDLNKKNEQKLMKIEESDTSKSPIQHLIAAPSPGLMTFKLANMHPLATRSPEHQ